MPDTYTYFILGYGILISCLVIYVVSLGVRQYMLEQKKKYLQDESRSAEHSSRQP